MKEEETDHVVPVDVARAAGAGLRKSHYPIFLTCPDKNACKLRAVAGGRGNNGAIIEAARIAGLTLSDRAADAGIHYGLRDWLVLERDDGARIWIKPDGIRWIERQAAHEPDGRD